MNYLRSLLTVSVYKCFLQDPLLTQEAKDKYRIDKSGAKCLVLTNANSSSQLVGRHQGWRVGGRHFLFLHDTGGLTLSLYHPQYSWGNNPNS